MTVRLRRSLASDLPYITALERDPANREMIGQWTDEQHLAAIRRENRREHWIIERDGAPAGYLIAYDGREGGTGIYVKRILVADKEIGTGSAALASFVAAAMQRDNAQCVWLIVYGTNARAQAVYRKLGFAPFEPTSDEAARYDRDAEPPLPGYFRMRRD